MGYARVYDIERGIVASAGEEPIDFVLHTDRGDIYLNILLDTKVRHKSYAYLSRSSRYYKVVYLYLTSYNLRGLFGSKSLDWFYGFRSLILSGVKNKEVVSSYKLDLCKQRMRDGEFSCSGDVILCPERGYSEVVTKEICVECPLCVGSGKRKMTCYGQGV